jgi:hypothetical protein
VFVVHRAATSRSQPSWRPAALNTDKSSARGASTPSPSSTTCTTLFSRSSCGLTVITVWRPRRVLVITSGKVKACIVHVNGSFCCGPTMDGGGTQFLSMPLHTLLPNVLQHWFDIAWLLLLLGITSGYKNFLFSTTCLVSEVIG